MANLSIKEAYEAVFNEDGTMKACGREACIRLIEACEAKDRETCFGNKKTGEICLSNIPIIKRLYLDEK